MHPDSPLKGESLCLFLMNFEQNNSIDFSNGISFRDRTMGESYNNSQNYEGYLPGRLHVFILYVLIDRQVIKIYFEVLSNDNGFGVYSFEKYVPGT